MSNDNYTPKYSSDDPDRIEEALPDAPPHDNPGGGSPRE